MRIYSDNLWYTCCSSDVQYLCGTSCFWQVLSVCACALLFPSQVIPKPMTSAAQVVTSSQTQQRLIMPAAPLPQIQPNLTNLPPGTVLAPAPGSGNMGYAVLPAQYVTQVCVSVCDVQVRRLTRGARSLTKCGFVL